MNDPTNIYDIINNAVPGILTIIGFVVGFLVARMADKPKTPKDPPG